MADRECSSPGRGDAGVPSIPSLHEVAGGRLLTICGKCLKYSDGVPGPSHESAWAELQRGGWSMYNAYALCPACTADPPNIEKDAARAKARRKRR
jgi:hypothetical protein